MRNGVTFGDLERLLTRSGFALSRSADTHRLYRHQGSDAIVVLPGVAATHGASPAHVAAVRRILRDRGLMDSEAFEELLQQFR